MAAKRAILLKHVAAGLRMDSEVGVQGLAHRRGIDLSIRAEHMSLKGGCEANGRHGGAMYPFMAESTVQNDRIADAYASTPASFIAALAMSVWCRPQ